LTNVKQSHEVWLAPKRLKKRCNLKDRREKNQPIEKRTDARTTPTTPSTKASLKRSGGEAGRD